MNEKNVKLGIYIVIVAIVIYYLKGAFVSILEGLGLKETKEVKETEKAPSETVKSTDKEIKDEIKKNQKSNVLTKAQKALILPTYNDAKYAALADTLYEAFNHTGTNLKDVENVFAQLKNSIDVKKLIVAYGVKQIYVFGLPDGKPSNLLGHLISENAKETANKGLQKNKVYYQF
jgi:hypothetical protein